MKQFMKKYIIFFSTLLIFGFEALLHYNIGKNDLKKLELPDLFGVIKTSSSCLSNRASEKFYRQFDCHRLACYERLL